MDLNSGVARRLCGGPVAVDTPAYGAPGDPPLIIINVHCDAGYSFGRILNLDRKTISAHATAVLAMRNTTPGSHIEPFINPPPPGYTSTTMLVAN